MLFYFSNILLFVVLLTQLTFINGSNILEKDWPGHKEKKSPSKKPSKSPVGKTLTPSSLPTSSSSSFNAIQCPTVSASSLNRNNASNFLTDFPESPIIEERFDIACSRSPYINGLCQKVMRKQYVELFEKGLYAKSQPRFRSVIYRPVAPPFDGGKYPVIMMIHGNFNACGSKLSMSVTDDGITKHYSWLDVAATEKSTQGASFFGNCTAGVEDWTSLADDIVNASGYHQPKTAEITAKLVNEANSMDPRERNQESHLGYRYVAEELAKRGFFVISVSSIQGVADINQNYLSKDRKDFGYIRQLARMGVATLELLEQWNLYGNKQNNTNGGDFTTFDLKGKLNLKSVGLMGHSRGGNAVRYMQTALKSKDGSIIGGSFPCFNPELGIYSGSNSFPYCRDIADATTGLVSTNYDELPDVNVKAVFEIAPTDVPYGGTLPSDQLDVDWAVLIPMCDQDVQSLVGRYPADRVINNAKLMKKLPFGSTHVIGIRGTSHDVYNTQWQKTDVTICDRQKPIQSQISGWDQTNRSHPVQFGEPLPRNLAVFFVSNFFAAYVLDMSKYVQAMDPNYNFEKLVPNPSNLPFRVIKEYVVGSKHSKNGRSYDLFEDAKSTQGAIIKKFGQTTFTFSKNVINNFNMGLSRTNIVQWDACLGNQITPSNIPVSNTCYTSRNSKKYFQISTTDDFICKSSFFLIGRGGCLPLVDVGSQPDPSLSTPGFDPVVILLFNNGKSLDMTPYTHISFSVAREMNALSYAKFTDFAVVGMRSNNKNVTKSDTNCVFVGSYINTNGKPALDGPDRNFIAGASFANPYYEIARDYNLFISDGTAYTDPSADSDSIIDVYFPEMIAVHIPLVDLNIQNTAVGIKLVLSADARVGSSGSLIMGPIQLINKSF